jgi:hypothetical protein
MGLGHTGQQHRCTKKYSHLNSPIWTRAQIVRSPWTEAFRTLVSTVRDDLMLVSPFIKSRATEQIALDLERRGVKDRVSVRVFTNLRPESALSGSLDLEALVDLGKALPKVELTHLPGLHAKAYIADNRVAIITSANLTEPGLMGNLEYGVAFSEEQVVTEIRRDFEGYGLLGARVESRDVESLLTEISELKRLLKKAEQPVRSQARRAFDEKLKATRFQVLRHRARGRTTHAILSDTILFLLARCPLRTTELHPLIQQLHPDICDDSLDRVLDGVHFGNRWKHYVRNAQQFLKRQRQIRFDGDRWHLASSD